MFESAEVGHTVDKARFEAEVPPLREALLDAQFDLVESRRFPVVVLIGGVDGAGKGETVNLLNEWLDPRHVVTQAMGMPTDEELERPPMFRFWRALPPRGKIGIFFGSWYTRPIIQRVYGETRDADLDRSLADIVRFERMLWDEGALVFKFWFHLSKDFQRKRLKKLAADPRTAWRVTKTDWAHFALYDKFRRISERSLRETSTAEAPWIVVEGSCPRYRSLLVGQTILEGLKARLADATERAPPADRYPVHTTPIDDLDVIRKLDLTQSVSPETYKEELEVLQGRLNLLSRKKRFHRDHALVAVFEGSDAAGKGGAIRRITRALDARQYRVVPVAAPTEEERAQPYLWRFWRHVPGKGRIVVFDRSWYGRVLVERVEGFCRAGDWQRAYGEINDFEEQLVGAGVILVKFWLQTSKEEQLRRFEERQATGFKRFKITTEDWRNREKWDQYETAVADMVDRTSTEIAPWTLVEANDKLFARVKVLRTLRDRLSEALA